MTFCDVCGGQDFDEILRIHEPDRFEKSIGIAAETYVRRWLQCRSCGAAVNKLPADAEEKMEALRSSYYEVDFAGSDIGAKYDLVMNLPSHKSDNAGRVSRILDFVDDWFTGHSTPVRRLLDIGAGTGVFLSRFKQQSPDSWSLTALEPDPDAARHLRKLDLFPVIEAMFQGQEELTGFDLITLNKVLEHIQDPAAFLSQVVAGLQPADGLIYVEVPDRITAWLRPPSDNILGSLHCHLYDPTSLATVLHKTGLEVLKVDRIKEPSGKLTVYAFAAVSSAFQDEKLKHG